MAVAALVLVAQALGACGRAPRVVEIHADREDFARALRKAFGVDRVRARDLAAWVQAAARGPRVLVNESVLREKPWPERIEVLAHELTHGIEEHLAGGRRFSTSEDRLANFAAAFGQPFRDFETEFAAHVDGIRSRPG